MSKMITISNGIISAVISEFGAEIKSLKKDEQEIMWAGKPHVWEGQAPFLFPICGALRDDKYILDGREYRLEKHGFASKMLFKTESRSETAVTFMFRETYDTLKCFPNTFECRITYELTENSLAVTYDVYNTDKKMMYFSMGAHESYACCGGIEEYSIVFENEEHLKCTALDGSLLMHSTYTLGENVRELPLKYKYFDDNSLVFTGLRSRKAILKHRNGKFAVSVEFEGFDYLLLWTIPEEEYICIEPWCGIPDYTDSDGDITHKEGIIALEPGKHCIRRHTIEIY